MWADNWRRCGFWFCPAPRSKARPRTFRPNLEPLVKRIAPAVTTSFKAGILTITSNNTPDTIRLVVNGNLIQFDTGPIAGAPKLGNTKVGRVLSNGGYDTIDASGVTGFAGSVRLKSGSGNDSLSGGAGIDLLLGAAGNDTLTGSPAFDLIDGDGADVATDRVVPEPLANIP